MRYKRNDFGNGIMPGQKGERIKRTAVGSWKSLLRSKEYSALRHASRTAGRAAELREMFRSLTSTGGVSPVTIRLDEYLYGRRTPQ